MEIKNLIELLSKTDGYTDTFASIDDEIAQRTERVSVFTELTSGLNEWLAITKQRVEGEKFALERAKQANGKVPAKLVRNVETGEMELVDMTPEEIKQRDADRAAAEAEANLPKPPTPFEELQNTVAQQGQQLIEILDLLRAK